MSFELKPDYDMTLKRFKAFWDCEIVDRAPVSLSLPVPDPVELPWKHFETLEERWLDVDFRAEQEAAALQNRIWYADSLPIAQTNMGPEIFSAWCGCGYQYGEGTTWSEPCIHDWETDADKAVLNREHPLLKILIKFTDNLIELGKGKFIVGLTDFHPGGDHVAALRDPQNLAMDMILNLDHVKKKIDESYPEYFEMYEMFYKKITDAGMPATSWTTIINDGTFYIPSNDFSCMISVDMFDDVFLPGIIKECKYYDRSIYHLDGPDALRHLDSLLAIDELDAVQWVPGAGNEGYSNWVKVYQKIQAAGKGIQLMPCRVEEFDLIFETLKPEGVWFSGVGGVRNKDDADYVLKRISEWK